MTALLLVLGRVVFGVRLQQPVELLMAATAIGVCFVGLLMFLATLGKTVDGVAGAAWGIMLPLAMVGGGTIPLFLMPAWMERMSDFSPVKWGILALEGAIWRGFTPAEMLLPCGILVGTGVVFFHLGVRKLSRGEE